MFDLLPVYFRANIKTAQRALAQRAAAPSPYAARCYLNIARYRVCRALANANAMRDRKRQALCLKILNWLRADLRRLSA